MKHEPKSFEFTPIARGGRKYRIGYVDHNGVPQTIAPTTAHIRVGPRGAAIVTMNGRAVQEFESLDAAKAEFIREYRANC